MSAGTITVTLTREEAAVVNDALSQWASEYATVAEYDVAIGVCSKITDALEATP